MFNWQEISQYVKQFITDFIRIAKARRREETAVAVAALLFYVGYSFNGWLNEDIKQFVQTWNGHLIIPAVFFLVGFGFFSYAFYRLWRLVFTPELPPPENRPSAVKGPLAFTEADGELFRKLGREPDLRKLLGYIKDDQVRLVIFFGASGAGKTSLLRAGLTDILKGENVLCHYWEAVPTDSAKSLLRAIQESWDTKQTDETAVILNSLDDLINPSEELKKNDHVIILDQFEQLRGQKDGQIFKLLQKLARKGQPPFSITFIVSFRREFRADWAYFFNPEQERGFHPPEIALNLFTPIQAKDVIGQLIEAAQLQVEDKIVKNLVEAATVEDEVSSVDIGIGLLILSELSARQGGKTVTEEDYYFAGGAEGLLTQYIDRCLNIFPDEDREKILNALLALRDIETNQRIAEGKTAAELAQETAADAQRLKTQLERLTQRDMRILEHAPQTNEPETCFRLPHERLIPALNRLAGKLLGELEDARSKLQNAFSAWKKQNSRQYLLKGKDLRLVEQYKTQIHWGKEQAEKQNFLKRSKNWRNLKRVTALVLIFALITTGRVVNTKFQRYEAEKVIISENYPSELLDYQTRLKVLELKKSLKSKDFSWLKCDNLEELSIKIDPSTNSIDGFTTALKKCPKLTKLSLDLSNSQIMSIDWSALKNLTQLYFNITGNERPNIEWSQLKNLTHLTLYISGSQIPNIEWRELKNLTQVTLFLAGNEIPNIEWRELKNLTHVTLYINSSQATSIEWSQLKNLTHLTLYISGNEIPRIEWSELKNLTQLSFSLGGNEIPNIEWSELKNLKQLTFNIIGSEISSIEWSELKNLTQLNLHISDSQIPNIEWSELKNLTQLYLYIAGNEIPNIEWSELKNLTQLNLYIAGNEIPNIEWSELKNLKQLTLNLRFSQIPNIEWSELKNLTHLNLNLRFSQIPNIEWSELKNLTHLNLDLRSSQITSIEWSALKNISELTLDLTNTKITDLTTISSLEKCEKLDLTLTTEQRMSLKTIPKSVTHLAF